MGKAHFVILVGNLFIARKRGEASKRKGRENPGPSQFVDPP
jgi:hypothetical protein